MAYAQESLETYLADAASNKPAPGGGSISALTGALAASMSEMAANFTAGKKKYEPVQAQVQQCLEHLQTARQELLALVDADVEAYEAVGRAYGMAKDTPDAKAARAEAIQAALGSAMEIPLRVVRQCRGVALEAAELVGIANPNLITDVGVSAILARAACEAARLNVEVNLKYIKDEQLVARARPEVDEAVETCARCCRDITRAVGEHLSK
ncbi:MAG: cyclodeaminase/cyclohydrolase family protein [Candidatus Brocadiia bacterium]|jgi:formiminotetrahydrofolate cyclodeaminase|nr:cyclodeaminase/cyclohydrolase family protein [Candidatus Brocadiia bacterium]